MGRYWGELQKSNSRVIWSPMKHYPKTEEVVTEGGLEVYLTIYIVTYIIDS